MQVDSIDPIREPYDYTQPQFEGLIHLVQSMPPSRVRRLLDELQKKPDIPRYISLGTSERIGAALSAGKRVQQKLEYNDRHLVCYVVQPLFREARRLSPRTVNNPHGENALNYKLSWFVKITNLFPSVRFHIIFVDDGCDGDGDGSQISGRVATRLLNDFSKTRSNGAVTAEVLYLDKLIPVAHLYGWEARIRTALDSCKGGSVMAAFAYALSLARDDNEDAIFAETDADLSVHPAQLMLLIEQLVCSGHHAAIASRRVPGSISYIDPRRDKRGRVFIQLWQELLPSVAKQVIDINRGMKAYTRDSAAFLVSAVVERTFPFQIECLTALITQKGAHIAEVPVSYIDSVALSTQTGDAPAQTYDDQLKRIRQIAYRYKVTT